ncbi:LiaF transmembrane domain-containing protein [Flavihumibacter petaseus]|uniref:LiaF transmembrane domain-containing protein n=1 Tax=Flavihumibacter petaseus NBRC 106054 TaxID=1220578 RepID=A0A0E9MV36_9BACT|nr:LiaF domain-containing protein [Flavihumibacter petaseus]GAO41612.1 hypothetical protein FPE01S_01_06260 [Flavihumibacter petaseus NBRC 106054]
MGRHHRFGSRKCQRGHRPNSILIGLLLLLAGGLLFARQFGFPIPYYLFTWQMFLIAVGVFSGIRSNFRGFGWAAPIIIGTIFLVRDYVPDASNYEPYIIPAVLVGVGLFIVLRNVGHHRSAPTDEPFAPAESVSDGERVEASSVFAGIRKNIISKTFSTGEVSAVFGSAEINMLQADLQPNAKIELNAVFGSIKLTVPAHWQLKIEANAVLGSVDDKRPQHSIYSDKVLIVEGNAVFGGIEIESH